MGICDWGRLCASRFRASLPTPNPAHSNSAHDKKVGRDPARRTADHLGYSLDVVQPAILRLIEAALDAIAERQRELEARVEAYVGAPERSAAAG
jgi:hypothetical protein